MKESYASFLCTDVLILLFFKHVIFVSEKRNMESKPFAIYTITTQPFISHGNVKKS